MSKGFNTENTDSDNDESKDIDDKDSSIWALILIVLILIFGFITNLITRRRKKVEFYEIYDISDKTFKKWIVYFCSDVMTAENWKKKRILTRDEFKAIQYSLGKPEPKSIIKRTY